MYQDSKLLKAAELYYIERLSQSQIAAEMAVSAATVSRMLNEALTRGMIHVEIRDPMKRSSELERALESMWGLELAIVSDSGGHEESPYKTLGKKAAELLPQYCGGKKTLGLGCGRTILETAMSLDPALSFPDLRVVPMMGGWGVEEIEREANRLAAIFGQRWGCKFQYLLLPAVLSSPETLELIRAEPQIRLTTDRWEHLDAALFSLGPEISAANYSYLPLEAGEIRKARSRGGVGDVLGRLLDENSRELDLPFNNCLASIPLELLRRVPVRIAAAGGRGKLKILRAALKNKLFNVLVTNTETAEHLVNAQH